MVENVLTFLGEQKGFKGQFRIHPNLFGLVPVNIRFAREGRVYDDIPNTIFYAWH